MAEHVVEEYRGEPEWFTGEWGTPEVLEHFEQARQEQITLGIHEKWARSIGRLIVEQLDSGEPLYAVEFVIEVAENDLAAGRPLALQIGDEVYNNHQPEGAVAYMLTSVDPKDGRMGDNFISALSTTIAEGTVLPPQGSDEKDYSEDQRTALQDLLTWQRANGLLIPGRQ